MNLKTIRKNINALSTEVYATYEDVIKRIEKQSEKDNQLAKRALFYIFCARRSLKVKELRHVLIVKVKDIELDEIVFSETEILLNISVDLISVDEKSSITWLVYYILQKYLEKNHEKLLSDFEVELATTCLTYLSFNVFDSESCNDEEALNQRLQVYQFLDYASHCWNHHVIENQLRMNLILTYLKND